VIEEKNKLKYLKQQINDKKNDLATVLSFSKIIEIENHIEELKKDQLENEKKLGILENIK
jgi:hypothetical protein